MESAQLSHGTVYQTIEKELVWKLMDAGERIRAADSFIVLPKKG
jgi:hypothetical protein